MRLPADYDPGWTLSFLGTRAVSGLEVVSRQGYGRVVALGDRHHWFEGQFSTDAIRHRTNPGAPQAEGRRVAQWLFDLDSNLEPFQEMARRDRVLGPLVKRRPGLRRPLVLDPFEATVRAIIGQLVSVAAATTVVTRLVRSFGATLTFPHGSGFAFPTPADVATAGRHRLGKLGLAPAKANALVAVAEGCRRGDISWAELRQDSAMADRVLQAIPGIGPWTSAYVRWRGLGDPDAFPDTDLGIIKALEARGVTRRDITSQADRWRPWRGFAVCHLWASLAE